MRTVKAEDIVDVIAKAVCDINFHTPPETMERLKQALKTEKSEAGRGAMDDIIKNREIASQKEVPMCQDTGMAVVFVELGEDVKIEGSLKEAIHEGVKKGYKEGYLRPSVADDPLFERKNTQDNTPAIIHIDLVEGDGLKFTVGAKGFGSENMSQVLMLKPADGVEGVKRSVLELVKRAGPNPCPPIVVGVGIGGDLELAAILAKKALMRKMGKRNPDPRYAKLEEELLELVNKTGIGPQGYGGINTAMDVRVEYYPTHIAGLPLAVNIDCHLHRHKEVRL